MNVLRGGGEWGVGQLHAVHLIIIVSTSRKIRKPPAAFAAVAPGADVPAATAAANR